MKKLFIGLIFISLSGCAAMNNSNYSRSNINAAREDFNPTDLSNVQYLYSLNSENSLEQESAEGASPSSELKTGLLANRLHQQGSFFEFNSPNEPAELN